MPILAENMDKQIRAALDAENSDRYDEILDIVPAINWSIKEATNIVNSFLSANKVSEEFFSEISLMEVFRTSKNSTVEIDTFSETPWTILSVVPKPKVGDTPVTIAPMIDDNKSYLREDKYYIDNDKSRSCKRLSIEEWTGNAWNSMSAGSQFMEGVCEELKAYGYLNPISYNPDGQSAIKKEIKIRPVLDKETVAIAYAKLPEPIIGTDSVIGFPESMENILVNLALSWISRKEGDETNIYQVSQQDLALLFNSVQT